jgi:hypothetical protein
MLSMLLLVTAGLFTRSVLNLWAVPIGYAHRRRTVVADRWRRHHRRNDRAGFAARWLDTILFGVSPADPWILAGSGTLLLIVATIAMAKPVTRACRINPLEALHEE